ncbi:ABC transporter ATP-binding protein [candidate division WOR-3 bacterium]|nr:ABC transporter ATP-binding protein [candidate division WOR-3 bacterium]
MLKIERACFSYGRNFSLREIDLHVKKGSLTALIGPNGSGKSTLLKIAVGYSRPDEGNVIFLGSDIGKIPTREKSKLISYLPQFTAYELPFTVEQTVFMGRFPWLGSLGFAGKGDFLPLKEIMQEFSLTDIAGRKFQTLSGGERQRTMIAASLAQSAVFLALDEPTASLDISHQIEIYRKLRRLSDCGTTILMASHNITLAGVYSDEIVVLKEGRLAAKGKPREIIDEKTVRSVFGEELALVYEDGVPLIFPRPS